MEDWALIRRLAAEGVPKARIAERLGISRTTVLKAVRSDSPPQYERTPTDSSFVAFEPRVRALLRETPDMPGDGARGAGRLDGVDHVVPGRGETVAAGIPADRPGGSADLGSG